MMFNTKYESSELCSFRQEDYWKRILKTFFWPSDLLMQPIITIYTTLFEEHQEIVPVKFGQTPMSGCREEVVWIKVNARAREHTHTRTHDGQTHRWTEELIRIDTLSLMHLALIIFKLSQDPEFNKQLNRRTYERIGREKTWCAYCTHCYLLPY